MNRWAIIILSLRDNFHVSLRDNFHVSLRDNDIRHDSQSQRIVKMRLRLKRKLRPLADVFKMLYFSAKSFSTNGTMSFS